MTRVMDTGRCVQESLATLQAQQRQLVDGRRPAQMFPLGTKELPLPDGFARHENARGVFHFAPSRLSGSDIDTLSREGRENEILLLGPYSKPEITWRVVNAREHPVCVCERTPDGIELRSAAGTVETVPEQVCYFEATKDNPRNVVSVSELLPVILNRIAS